MRAVVPDILAAVGDTPMVRLDRFGRGLGHVLIGKCEFMNPGGSVKDRVAAHMVTQAERRGELGPQGTIVEATAGNTGAALATVAALRGYHFVAVVTTKASREKVNTLRALGATVIICRSDVPPTHPRHFVAHARALARTIPGAWYAEQFSNPDNVAAHRASTGPEILAQTGGEIDALVGGIGTGGTLAGAGSFLKEQLPGLEVVLADPCGSLLRAAWAGEAGVAARRYLVEGIGGDFVPDNARLDQVDAVVAVSDAAARAAMLDLARQEGIFVGASAGCIAAAAHRFARRCGGRRRTIVALLPDGGRNYLSTFYDDTWWARHAAHADASSRRLPAPSIAEEAPCMLQAMS